MMQQLGAYVVTLTCGAMVCSILLALPLEGAQRGLVKLACGVFLTVTALGPLPGLELPQIPRIWEDFQLEGQAAAQAGAAFRREAELAIIKQELESYILDKGQNLGLALQAEVDLSEEGLPLSVKISPEPKREDRIALSEFLTRELGIPKENQQWSG